MASKTGKGSIVQMEKGKAKGKCRKWKLVVSLGRDPITGKYPQKSRVFHGTFTEAQKALRELVEEVESGTVIRRSQWTFNDYAEHFIEARRATGEYTDISLDTTRTRLKQIGYRIGHLKMQEVTPSVLAAAYIDLKNGKSKSGKKLSGTTVNCTHKAVSVMFAHAVKEGVVASNPCKSVDTPKTDTRERKPLTKDQVHELISKLDPAEPMEVAIILCITLGLRRGEAVGLSWGDVDLVGNTVGVRHSFDRFRNLKEPKTVAGTRILPMSPFTAEALSKRHAAQMALYGEGPNEFVSRTPEGSVMLPTTPVVTGDYEQRANPDSLSGWWRRNRAALGVPGTTLHELRHSFLSLAAQQGVHPSVMQKLAGHNDPTITLGIYTHVNMEQQRQAMTAMQGVFE